MEQQPTTVPAEHGWRDGEVDCIAGDGFKNINHTIFLLSQFKQEDFFTISKGLFQSKLIECIFF